MKQTLIKLLLSLFILLFIIAAFVGDMYLILLNPRLGIITSILIAVLLCWWAIYSSINLKPYEPKKEKKKNPIS